MSSFLDVVLKIVLIIILAITGLYLMGSLISYGKASNDELLIISKCKLLEENHYNGFFSENTNKLDCNGVIKNIPISEYEKAINLKNDKG